MLKKMLATTTAVVAGLAVVGVAWAGHDDAGLSAEGSTQVSTAVAVAGDDDSTDASVDAESTTDVTVDASTPTTIDDDDSTTSTSVDDDSTDDSTTSTTLDDDDDDDEDRVSVAAGISTHVVPGVGSVTISAHNGTLALVSVVTSWEIEEQRVETDRIEIEFVSGDAEAEFEARINGGRVEVRIEID